jgi:uncharacterized membrane protein
MGAPPPPAASVGLQTNAAGALCYLLGLVTGIIFLVLEPYNKNPEVRFHAFQSIFLNVAMIVYFIGTGILTMMLHFVALIFIPINMLVSLGFFCLWLFMMWKTYNNSRVELPIIGAMARQQAGS